MLAIKTMSTSESAVFVSPGVTRFSLVRFSTSNSSEAEQFDELEYVAILSTN